MATPPESGAAAVDARQRARSILQQRSAFAACPDNVIDDILRRARTVRFAKGETVYRQGEAGDNLIIVLSGGLKVINVTTEAKEVVLGFERAGALLGEIAALDGRERTATVITLEPTEAMLIYRRDLMPILRSSQEAMEALLEGLCGRIRATNALIESYSLETEARVASCLVRLVEEHGRTKNGETSIDFKISQKDLGNHLGLTRETISRTLSSFRERGLIDVRANVIVVLDPPALATAAEGAA